jgi:hypothetical protein
MSIYICKKLCHFNITLNYVIFLLYVNIKELVPMHMGYRFRWGYPDSHINDPPCCLSMVVVEE